MTDLQILNNVKKFDCYTISCLEQEELGTQGFAEIAPDLDEIRCMINEMIAMVETRDHVTAGLTAAIDRYINDYNDKANAIMLYDVESDAMNDFVMRNAIIKDISTWVKSIYNGCDDNKNPYCFMTLYNSLKLNDMVSLQKERSSINKLKAELKAATEKANELVGILQNSSSEMTPYDYTAMFRQKAINSTTAKQVRKESSFFVSVFQFIVTIALIYLVVYLFVLYFY